jgi:hypothetical protein
MNNSNEMVAFLTKVSISQENFELTFVSLGDIGDKFYIILHGIVGV